MARSLPKEVRNGRLLITIPAKAAKGLGGIFNLNVKIQAWHLFRKVKPNLSIGSSGSSMGE